MTVVNLLLVLKYGLIPTLAVVKKDMLEMVKPAKVRH